MKKRILLSLTLTLSVLCFSQEINTSNTLHATENMILNVKQFGQFINRFNYKEDFAGKKITPEFQSKFPREKYLVYLFNSQDKRIKENDVAYNSLIDEFIKAVTLNSILIPRFSEKIYAHANCEILYDSEKRNLDLLLKPEHVNEGVKWVIHDVLNIEDILWKNVDMPKVFIPPTSNEVNFTHLKRAFEDKTNFYNYYSDEYQQNPLNRLYQEVQKGLIEFQHVNKLTYVIFEVDGWIIEVNEFIRDDINSGWLISNLEKSDINEKDYFRK